MLDIDISQKRVLIRQDLNVPINEGIIASDARLRASLPSIKAAIKANAAVILMSHLGRPKEGEYDVQYSLKPVADYLSEHLGQAVKFVKDYLDVAFTLEPGQVALLENVRFNLGEKSNADELAKRYAELAEVFVMDAFGTAHRAQASTHGVAKYTDQVCAGPLLQAELDALAKALDKPARPMVAIVGGSKVSTKLTVLESLSSKVDQLIVGGGIANTFIAAQGHNVGKSLFESDLIAQAELLMNNAKSNGGNIPVPSDVVVGQHFSKDETAIIKSVQDVEESDMIFDIGPESAKELTEILKNAGTIVWNGPVGVFEFDQFAEGTKAIAQAIAESSAFSIAGGGDTLAAVDKYKIADKVSYISTGGGAFLEFLEGKELPAVSILDRP
ncbi:phosphoglycerate kinase [Aestuariibacter sp. P117]|uniref:Phosphoglycerate kinase n=2 Tax=Glaciecola petra TaxID=3075602 RepID=A0ABU2ZM89_9ALTE|nr:phosphoglycerate kinase [Aestuariibacter sp. P117]MDT0593469.1 phosphoglycerate kinase [Aestuariibacter sp. P117]